MDIFNLGPIFLLFFIQSSSSLECPSGTMPSYHLPSNQTNLPELLSQCLHDCNTSNCTGVVIRSGSCVSVNIEDFYGEIASNQFVKKDCVAAPEPTITRHFPGLTILASTEREAEANEDLECIALCAKEKVGDGYERYTRQEFNCSSVMFYKQLRFCLLNSFSSRNAQLSTDNEEGVGVELIEVERLAAPNTCSNADSTSSHSLRMVKVRESLKIKGEAKLFNGTAGLDDCITRCQHNCDFVLFNEAYSECFIVHEDPVGQSLSFINAEFTVLENLCRPLPLRCGPQNSVFIASRGVEMKLKEECAVMCMSSPGCSFAYAVDGKCMVSDKPLQLTRVLERKCAGLEANGYGVLFDETAQCMTGHSLTLHNVAFVQCLAMCVTHPTSSCEGVSYYAKDQKCLLLDGKLEPVTDPGCIHYSLNIITTDPSLIEVNENGSASGEAPPSFPIVKTTTGKPRWPLRGIKNQKKKTSNKNSIAFASKTHRRQPIKNIVEKKKVFDEEALSHVITGDDLKITVYPECRYDGIRIKVKASRPFRGSVFPRNKYDDCHVEFFGQETEIILSLGNGTCGVETVDANTYSTVLVVARSQNNTVSPVITSEDPLFHVSCRYSGDTTVVAKANPLTLLQPSYHKMSVGGHVNTKGVQQMKMLRKDENEIQMQTVQLGESLELSFESEKLANGYRIRECAATEPRGSENMTVIINGCPAPGADTYVLRGPVKHRKNGFTLSIRAFKFSAGNSVRFSCKVEMCPNCKRKRCDLNKKRSRRDLPAEEGPIEDVHVEMEVFQDSADCVCASIPYFVSCLGGLGGLLLLQAVTLAILFKDQETKNK